MFQCGGNILPFFFCHSYLLDLLDLLLLCSKLILSSSASFPVERLRSRWSVMNYEERVEFLGSWGPFQRRVFFVVCVTAVPSGFAVLSVIFLLAAPVHHCFIPTHANLSPEWTQALTPAPEQSSCSRYDLALAVNASVHGLSPGLGSGLGSGPNVSVLDVQTLPLERCQDGLSFSQEDFTSTVVTEFVLVCEQQWKQPLSSLVYFMGGLCGCFVSGQLSDRFGRKPVLFGSLLLMSFFCTGMTFAPSWPLFIGCFFMVGVGQITVYIVGFVHGSELLTGRTRVLFSGLGLPFCYVLGSMLLPFAAYLLPDWRHLSSVMAASCVACLPLWWLVPESPRWLLSKGFSEKAEMILLSAASVNQVQAPVNIFSSEKMEKVFRADESSPTFLDLLKTRNIRNITLLLWLSWFSIHISYFGLSFNMASLSGSLFMNYFLVAAIELPAYGLSWAAASRCPRRWAVVLFGSVGTSALLCSLVTTDTHPIVTLSLVLLGKFGVLAGISTVYILTGELYPTNIRNTAMSSCAMFSRVGSSLSPYLQALALVQPSLPWLLVASLALLSVMLILFLPETFHQPLPDTIQQMNNPSSVIFRCCSTSREKIHSKTSKGSADVPDPVVICTTLL